MTRWHQSRCGAGAERAWGGHSPEHVHVIGADREAVFELHCPEGPELGVPVDLAQGLAGAKPSDLSEIEISPTGLGLHWPRLDADLYLPALLEGLFGTRRWMAKVMGKAGGRSSSAAKQAAVRVR